MTDFPDRFHRRSVRLKGYDYSRAGTYFVTACVQGRESLFGAIEDGRMSVNPAGEMVGRWWLELENKFRGVSLDEHVVMPNHFHGIIVIHEGCATRFSVGAALCGRPVFPPAGERAYGGEEGQPHRAAPTDGDAAVAPCGRPVFPPAGERAYGGEEGQPHRAAPTDGDDGAPPPPTLGEIIGWFKTMTTNAYIRGVKAEGWPAFVGRLWQRNYYEHVIRDEAELDGIRAYLVTNPALWSCDVENPRALREPGVRQLWER